MAGLEQAGPASCRSLLLSTRRRLPRVRSVIAPSWCGCGLGVVRNIASRLDYPETNARKALISDATKSANVRTRGVRCMSRCISRWKGVVRSILSMTRTSSPSSW